MRPIRLSRRREPFDSDQFIFELKIDGFRALAHIEAGALFSTAMQIAHPKRSLGLRSRLDSVQVSVPALGRIRITPLLSADRKGCACHSRSERLESDSSGFYDS